MAYDYSSDNKRLELPNPFRVENSFLFACAVITLAGGVVGLLWAREAIQANSTRLGIAPLLVGVALLAAGFSFAVVAARRLRFFFGRGRPRSLAPEVAIGATGNSARADFYKTTLRQGGLEYPEPQGALNGVLYHAVPRLITAPLVVQELAQRHFFNALSFLVTLASFLFAWGLFGTQATRPLISIVYFVFGAAVLLLPLVSGNQANLGTGSLIALIVAAIVGPVAAGMLGAALPSVRYSVTSQAVFLLVCALVAVVLILCALHAQLDASPQTERACEQRTLSMNGPPASLITELDRTLQDQWVEKIPNRRYTRIEPVTEGAAGSGRFAGELLEETQPMPMSGTAAVTFGSALREPRHSWLVMLDLYGTLLTIIGVVCALVYVRGFDPSRVLSEGWGSTATVGYAAVCLAIAAFCFQSAGAIWGRFNFESALVWVELLGTWQSSRIGTGNQFNSRLHTENDVVRVEAMTLRIWRARVESVVFGKDGQRQVTAMYATSQEAARLASDLQAFADRQSVFAAPRAAEDQHRIAALQATEALLGGNAPSLARVEALAGAPGAPRVTSAPAPASPAPASSARFCTACGTRATADARFCSACGTALPQP
ncbi:MAG: zinc ribbon domain-containing protein [Caulobacter sp.]|nr:zinc ribbon domain-containing protein [Vitreoscilla sp.]